MKLIGISQRMRYLSHINEVRDEIDQRLVSFISFCGYIPVTIPNNLGKNLEDWLNNIQIKAIVLSGGDNIGNYSTRDKTELKLLDFAKKNKLSVLGICRGMQMIGHWSGITLHEVQNHNRTKHKIFGKSTRIVNSYHSYSLKECPKGFEILARSLDNEIEAIRCSKLNWEGWMWHPEREEKFLKTDVENINLLFGI